MSENSYDDVPEGFYVREDADYGEVLVSAEQVRADRGEAQVVEHRYYATDYDPAIYSGTARWVTDADGEGHFECMTWREVAEEQAKKITVLSAAAQRVEALAEELDGWRDNAQRYADGAVLGSGYERSLGRVRAYERAIEGIRRALGTTS